jgi:hypothetical protein
MDEHVDGGSNPNEMAEAVYKIIQTKEPRSTYKVGFYAAIFDCIETFYRIKSTKNADEPLQTNQVKYKRITKLTMGCIIIL